MATNGEDIDMGIVKSINESVFLAESSGPKAGEVMSQGLGLAQAGHRISAQHFFENCAEIFVHPFIPLPQILVNLP